MIGNGLTWGKRANLAGVLSGCLGSASGGSVGLFGLFLGRSAAYCLGGGSVSWGRVVLRSVVRLPLVWVGGVLSGLHPPPFLVSVSGLGVPLVGASGLGVVSGCRVWLYIAPVERSHICTRF